MSFDSVLPGWLRGTLAPDEVIGEHKMLRWWLLPRNRWFSVYVHKHQGNDPRTPHDHPCDNISIRLRGELIEFTPRAGNERSTFGRKRVVHDRTVFFYHAGMAIERCRLLPLFTFRRAEQPHRLEIALGCRPCWTLWIRFRNRRRWGYYELAGWRPAKTARQP